MRTKINIEICIKIGILKIVFLQIVKEIQSDPHYALIYFSVIRLQIRWLYLVSGRLQSFFIYISFGLSCRSKSLVPLFMIGMAVGRDMSPKIEKPYRNGGKVNFV